MTWLGQVWHVMKKDLRQERKLLLVYAVIVALATAKAFELPGTSFEVMSSAPLLVMLCGMIAVASLVQGDSPTRSDAFWASRPFHPSAMLAAKVGFAFVFLMLLPLACQALALASHGIEGRDAWWIMGGSAGLLAIVFVSSIAIAAVTPDLKSFVLVVIALPVFTGIVVAIVSNVEIPMLGPNAKFAVTALSQFGALALVAWLYRERDLRRRVAIIGVALAGALVLGMFAPSPGNFDWPDLRDAPPSVRRAAIRVEVQQQQLRSIRDPELVVTAGSAPPSQRLSLFSGKMAARLRNGQSVVMPLQNQRATITTPTVPSVNGARWLDAPSTLRRVVLQAKATGEQRLMMEGGIVSLALSGRVDAIEPRISGTLPLVPGATMSHDGVQVTVDSWEHRFGDGRLVLSTSRLMRKDAPTPPGFMDLFDVPEFALLNEQRGEMIALPQGGSSTLKGWLVLPVTFRETKKREIEIGARSAIRNARVDDEWLRGAKLVVIDWVPLGSYPVRAEVAVP